MTEDIPTIPIDRAYYDNEYFDSMLETFYAETTSIKRFRIKKGNQPIFMTGPMVIDNHNVRITRSRLVIGNNPKCEATRAFVAFSGALIRYLSNTPFFKTDGHDTAIRCQSIIGKSVLPYEENDGPMFQGIVLPLGTMTRSADNQRKFQQVTRVFIKTNDEMIMHEPSEEPYDIHTLDKATDYESILKPYLQNGKYTIRLAILLNAIVRLGKGHIPEITRTKLLAPCLQIQIEHVPDYLQYQPTDNDIPPDLSGRSMDIKAKFFSQFKFDSDEGDSSSDEDEDKDDEDDHSSADE